MENNKKIKIEDINGIKTRVNGWVTMEDALLNCPIGSQICLKDGRTFIKYTYNVFEECSYDKNIVSANEILNKVEEIQLPEYTRVVKSKGEVLDEKEKEYLNAVIAPFRSKVVSIEKEFGVYERIKIEIIEEDNRTYYKYIMEFPRFEAGTMYKGMESNKEYTLEELGLEGE